MRLCAIVWLVVTYDSSDTECVNIALCWVSSDVVSTDSDGSGGGIEHCDGSSTGFSVGQPHCDSVV